MQVKKRIFLTAATGMFICANGLASTPQAYAACAALPTDRGQATQTITVPANGTYRVWSRIWTANSANNSYLLQIDQTNCNINVGGKSLTANTWNWVNYKDGNTTTPVDITLTAGSHTLTMAGNADAVQLDRIILTQDLNCTPVDAGDNCIVNTQTTPPVSTGAVAVDQINKVLGTGTVSASVTNSKPELVVAWLAADAGNPGQSFTVSGSGLNWKLAGRANTQAGDSEVWWAITTGSSVTATATPGQGGYGTQLTLATYANAQAIGATKGASGASGAQSVTLTPQASGSLVAAVGNDWDNALARTPGTNQILDAQDLAGSGDTFWVQHLANPTTQGQAVTLNDTAPTTDQWNFLAVELAPGTPPSPGTTDTTPPVVSLTAPTNNATVSSTVSINATASDNVGVTKLEYYLDGNLLSTGAATSYSWDTTKTTNESHTVAVRAYDAVGNIGNASLAVTVQNGDTAAPSAATNLSATAAAYNKVNLTWTAATDTVGVSGYYVQRKAASSSTFTTIATIGATTSYSDTSVNAQSGYTYQLVAFDAAGNYSAPSNSASTTTPAAPDTTPPSAPTNLSALATSSSAVNLTWAAATDNTSVAGYDVYRNGGKIGSTNGTSFGDTGLNASTTYSYYVIARDSAGNTSQASATASVTTQATLPATNTGTLSGTVLGSGNPLSRASVSLVYGGTTHRTSTSSTGAYTLTGIPAGTYRVTYSARRWQTQTISVTIRSTTATVQNITMSRK